jgi:hypothetical protein
MMREVTPPPRITLGEMGRLASSDLPTIPHCLNPKEFSFLRP